MIYKDQMKNEKLIKGVEGNLQCLPLKSFHDCDPQVTQIGAPKQKVFLMHFPIQFPNKILLLAYE